MQMSSAGPGLLSPYALKCPVPLYLKCPHYCHHLPCGQKKKLFYPIALGITWVRMSSSDPVALELRTSSHVGKEKGRRGGERKKGSRREEGTTGPVQHCMGANSDVSSPPDSASASWPKQHKVSYKHEAQSGEPTTTVGAILGLRIRKLLDLFSFLLCNNTQTQISLSPKGWPFFFKQDFFLRALYLSQFLSTVGTNPVTSWKVVVEIKRGESEIQWELVLLNIFNNTVSCGKWWFIPCKNYSTNLK